MDPVDNVHFDNDDEMEEEEKGDDDFQGRWATQKDTQVVLCGSLRGLNEVLLDGLTDLELQLENPDERDEVVALLKANIGKFTSLSLYRCAFEGRHLVQIGEALSGSSIAYFGISENEGLSEAEWSAFWPSLPSGLMKLDVGDNNLQNAGVSLFKELHRLTKLQQLFLDGNGLENITELAKALPKMPDLLELDLGDNLLDDGCMLELCPALEAVPKLLLLVLGTNMFESRGPQELFKVLPSTNIEVLYLDNAGVNDDAVAVLGEHVAKTKLTEVHLDSNPITDVGASKLIPNLPASDIDYLDVQATDVSSTMIEALRQAIGADFYVSSECADGQCDHDHGHGHSHGDENHSCNHNCSH